MALVGKKLSKPSKKLRRNPYIQLVKKSLKLNEKTKKKIGDSINKKPPKLNEKTRKKTNHLYFVYCFIEGEKSSKPS